MQSLKEVYGAMTHQDHVKVAQVRQARGERVPPDMSGVDPALLKQAQDYDQIGRVLAHHVFADLVKEAMDDMPLSEEEKAKELAKVLAMANGEAPPKEGEGEKKEEEPKGEEAEKKAAAKAKAKKKILKKMAEDPNYLSALISKHL